MANNMTLGGGEDVDTALLALGEQLEARDAAFHLVVVGGSALLALDLVRRPTADVDVVGFRAGTAILSPKPFPQDLRAARDQVAGDLRLPEGWINAGPASLLDFGLPEGFVERLITRHYGRALVVSFASRFDQIHFKLYATVDQGPGKHLRDLEALGPSREELVAAALWSRTHDPSEGYREMLLGALTHLGVTDADVGA